MQQNTLVAVCDILGFSRLVLNSDHDYVLNHYSVFRRLVEFALERRECVPGPDLLLPLKDIRNDNEHVGFARFSDTVVFYAKKNDDRSYYKVIETVMRLLFTTIFAPQTRCRGGIAYGEFLADPEEEIFIGRALVEAYELERNQEWCGAALTPSAVSAIKSSVPEYCPDEWPLCNYKVPLKPEYHNRNIDTAVDWTRGIHVATPDFLRWSIDKTDPDEGEEKEDVVRKFKNTRAFHEAVCKVCSKRR